MIEISRKLFTFLIWLPSILKLFMQGNVVQVQLENVPAVTKTLAEILPEKVLIDPAIKTARDVYGFNVIGLNRGVVKDSETINVEKRKDELHKMAKHIFETHLDEAEKKNKLITVAAYHWTANRAVVMLMQFQVKGTNGAEQLVLDESKCVPSPELLPGITKAFLN